MVAPEDPCPGLSLGWQSGQHWVKGGGGGANCFPSTFHHGSRLSVHFSFQSSKVQWETRVHWTESVTCSAFLPVSVRHGHRGQRREHSMSLSWRCSWSRKRWNPGPLGPALCFHPNRKMQLLQEDPHRYLEPELSISESQTFHQGPFILSETCQGGSLSGGHGHGSPIAPPWAFSLVLSLSWPNSGKPTVSHQNWWAGGWGQRLSTGLGAEMGLEPHLSPSTSLDRFHLRASGDLSTKFWIVLQSCHED